VADLNNKNTSCTRGECTSFLQKLLRENLLGIRAVSRNGFVGLNCFNQYIVHTALVYKEKAKREEETKKNPLDQDKNSVMK